MSNKEFSYTVNLNGEVKVVVEELPQDQLPWTPYSAIGGSKYAEVIEKMDKLPKEKWLVLYGFESKKEAEKARSGITSVTNKVHRSTSYRFVTSIGRNGDGNIGLAFRKVDK